MKADYINNWHRIWSNRTSQQAADGSMLERLISADGFDSPLGLMAENDWRAYVALFAKRTEIVKGDSIFEVGCGAGAFLYPFYEASFEIGGIDYSRELIQIAQNAMPEKKSEFNTQEASVCQIAPRADVVVANHVIHYFYSLDYSFTVLDLMLRKAIRVVSISGIPDADKKENSEKERRGLLTAEEYEPKYRGLELLYYKKEWFSEMASAHGFDVQFFPHEMPGFAQNRFRFDCVMKRV